MHGVLVTANPLPAVFSWYGISLGASEIVSAIFLAWRAVALGTRRSTAIAAAYAFAAPLVVGNLVTFPVTSNAPEALGSQIPAWFWVSWHVGWTALMVIYAWLADGPVRHPARFIGVSLAAAFAIAFFLNITNGLPVLVLAGSRYAPLHQALSALTVALALVAASGFLVRRRARHLMDATALVAVASLGLDAGLHISSAVRFSISAFVGRFAGALSGVSVMLGAIAEYAAVTRRSRRVERYAQIAEATPQIVFLQQLDGTVTFVNERWSEATGKPAQSAFGGGFADSTHPGDSAEARLRREAATPNCSAFEYDLRLRAIDGSWRWYAVRVVPLRDADRSVMWLGTMTNVDEQRRALAAALAREEELRRVAAAIPQMVWTAHPNGAVDWFNSRFYEYTGRSHEDVLDFGWLTLAHADDETEVRERWDGAIAQGEPLEAEASFCSSANAYRWFLIRVVPVRDDDGRVVKWYGSMTDVDDRRRQGDELAKLYEREHHVAATLQNAFLPNYLPSFPGITLDAVYRAATREAEVGGDWFDAFPLGGNRIGISIGDVTGHGLEAATAMVRARETLRAAAGLDGVRPDAILALANRAIIGSGWNAMATAIFGVLDLDTMAFVFSSAGHPPPVLVRDGTRRLIGTGIPIGIDVEATYEVTPVDLESGDTLIFYTDGLIESTRDLDEGERRLDAVLTAGMTDPSRIVDACVTGVQRDDIAVLVLRIAASAGSKAAPLPGWRFATDSAAAAHHARDAFTRYLADRGLTSEEVFAAETVFGELVGNVVRHAPGPIEIDVAWSGNDPTLFVRDRGAGFSPSEAGATPDLFAESGRGLFMIRMFAHELIVLTRAGGGSEIAVRLRRTTELPSETLRILA